MIIKQQKVTISTLNNVEVRIYIGDGYVGPTLQVYLRSK